MSILKYVLIACAVISAIVILFAAMRTKRPMKTLISSAIGGIIALIAVAITGIFTGVVLNINLWTLLCAAFAGIPGVVLMLVMKMLWNM